MANLSLGKAAQKSQNEIVATFTVSGQGMSKRKFLVRKERVVVGTIVSADVRVDGDGVAPIHAIIELDFSKGFQSAKGRILDLASDTGVLVSGQKVIAGDIKSGDIIQIGTAVISFEISEMNFDELPKEALLLVQDEDCVPVFDYRNDKAECLEVVCSWFGTILDVKHFLEGEVNLGTQKADHFAIPVNFETAGSIQLATFSSDWSVHIDQKMSGVVYTKGSVSSFQNQKLDLVLKAGDFVKVEVGHLAFYLSRAKAPPYLKSRGNKFLGDAQFIRAFFASAVLTALTFIGVANMQSEQEIEAEQLPERIVTILYQPEKYQTKKVAIEQPEKPKPSKPKEEKIDFNKPQPKVQVGKTVTNPGKNQAAQNQAKEGEGARAKGAEGKRGSKTASNSTTPQNAAKRPSPEAGKNAGGTVSQSQDNGNVQMLKGQADKILDLLGGSGDKLGKSGQKLQGFGGFTSQGNGGLALSGSGKGGGGNADTLLGGLGDKGRGGGRVGTGLGAEGTGSGIIGGRTRVELRTGSGDEIIVMGGIDRDAIKAAIDAHRDEFKYCYDREVSQGNPNLAGKIDSRFSIGPSGRASQLAVANTTMRNPRVESCVLNVLSRIQFPKPYGGASATVTYPFTFNNPGR